MLCVASVAGDVVGEIVVQAVPHAVLGDDRCGEVDIKVSAVGDLGYELDVGQEVARVVVVWGGEIRRHTATQPVAFGSRRACRSHAATPAWQP